MLFHQEGTVNKHKSRYLADNNPRLFHEQPLYIRKITLGYKFEGENFGVLISYFFFQQDGVTVTATL